MGTGGPSSPRGHTRGKPPSCKKGPGRRGPNLLGAGGALMTKRLRWRRQRCWDWGAPEDMDKMLTDLDKAAGPKQPEVSPGKWIRPSL